MPAKICGVPRYSQLNSGWNTLLYSTSVFCIQFCGDLHFCSTVWGCLSLKESFLNLYHQLLGKTRKREPKLPLESSATFSLKVLPVKNVKLPLRNVHTFTKDYLWASKQPLESPQYTLVHCSIQMWGSHGYKWTASQKNGYSETEKSQEYVFKGYCLQIWMNITILKELCTVLSSAWMALCASQIKGFIFIYRSYLLSLGFLSCLDVRQGDLHYHRF